MIAKHGGSVFISNLSTPRLPGRNIAMAGMALTLLIVAFAMAVISWFAFSQADRALTYETLRKAESVARSLGSTFDRAAELGIPLDKMPGVIEKLEEVRTQHAELSRISVIVGGAPVFVARAPDALDHAETMVERLPIRLADGTSQILEVAVDPRFINRLFSELAMDFVVILIVAAFITLELIYFLTGPTIVAPLHSLTQSLFQLSESQVSGAIPGNFGGGLRKFSMLVRTNQETVLAEYRLCRDLLRKHLSARKMTSNNSVSDARLRKEVGSLRSLRLRFGLAKSAARELVHDPVSSLGRMRAPFFLLLLAEDLSRCFIPIYAGTMELGNIDIPPNLVVGLPIFLFMFIVAISQPTLGGWSERLGRRNAFLIGAVIAIVAHLLTAQATTLSGLLAWRASAGVAWAIAFVAAQGMVLDYTDKKTRTKGLATFVTVIMVSLACGPSVGGLLADGLGYQTTFHIAAFVAAVSLIIAWQTLPKQLPDRVMPTQQTPFYSAQTTPKNSVSSPTGLMTNWRFLGLLFLAAVPAKLILVAFCYYLIPLYLTASGNNAAMAGRIIMIYSVVMVLLVPITAEFLDRLRRRGGVAPHSWFVSLGIMLSGLGGMAMLIPNEIVAAAVLVTILGIAQSISISPQAAMVPELARLEIANKGEAVVYGYYRLVERIGSAIGPVAAAAMLQFVSFKQSFVMLGLAVLACGMLFAVLFVRPDQAIPKMVPAK